METSNRDHLVVLSEAYAVAFTATLPTLPVNHTFGLFIEAHSLTISSNLTGFAALKLAELSQLRGV